MGPIPLGLRLWGKVGMDRLFRPFYANFMVGGDRRDVFEEMGRHVVACGGCGGSSGGDDDDAGWEVETIIPCHGDIVRGRQLCRHKMSRVVIVKNYDIGSVISLTWRNPVRVASPPRINLEEPGQGGQPT